MYLFHEKTKTERLVMSKRNAQLFAQWVSTGFSAVLHCESRRFSRAMLELSFIAQQWLFGIRFFDERWQTELNSHSKLLQVYFYNFSLITIQIHGLNGLHKIQEERFWLLYKELKRSDSPCSLQRKFRESAHFFISFYNNPILWSWILCKPWNFFWVFNPWIVIRPKL